MATDVSVVLVSHNTRDLLRQCLRSVFASLYRPAEVFVVDNASADASEAMVAAEFPDVTLVALDRNLGFGGANNVALRRCWGHHRGRSSVATNGVSLSISLLVETRLRNYRKNHSMLTAQAVATVMGAGFVKTRRRDPGARAKLEGIARWWRSRRQPSAGRAGSSVGPA